MSFAAVTTLTRNLSPTSSWIIHIRSWRKYIFTFSVNVHLLINARLLFTFVNYNLELKVNLLNTVNLKVFRVTLNIIYFYKTTTKSSSISGSSMCDKIYYIIILSIISSTWANTFANFVQDVYSQISQFSMFTYFYN